MPINERYQTKTHQVGGSTPKKFKEFIGEFIYGGIDGAITTFAVVAGAAGASLNPGIVLILGVSNLLADGLSMSIGDYLSTKSEKENYDQLKAAETIETEKFPEAEKNEIRDIYKAKGFEGELLEQIIDTIISDQNLWVDEIMIGEHGLSEPEKNPLHSAGVTFGSFQIMGLIPLIPYVWAFTFDQPTEGLFFWSSLFTSVAFVIIGFLKSWVNRRSRLRGIIETVLLGGIAACVAYFVGKWLEAFV